MTEINNAKEAREILSKRPGWEQVMVDPNSDCEMVWAKGYLEGLEDGRKEEREKAKGLINLLDVLVKNPALHSIGNYSDLIKETLAQYEEAVKFKED